MTKNIDLNCDLGEGFGRYKVADDRELMSRISSCNIACGFHAGDPTIIMQTINLAASLNVAIGAHPSYPDLQGFGRRSMQLPEMEFSALLKYQISALKGMSESIGVQLHHVKPHGALYHDTALKGNLSEILCEVIADIDLGIKLYGLAGSQHQIQAEKYGIKFISEAFGDRKYTADGKLAPRSIDGSVIDSVEGVTSQVLSIINQNEAKTVEGDKIAIEAETICIHGDSPNATNMLVSLNQVLKSHNIAVVAP
ncbi:MAG: LamB/YcsF family protein [Cyclobacteriaceae bacterium]